MRNASDCRFGEMEHAGARLVGPGDIQTGVPLMTYRSDTLVGDDLTRQPTSRVAHRSGAIFESQDVAGAAVATLMMLGPLLAYSFGF
ncbi:hypothetical protein D5400_20100 [Georhizobium profundi]|uniref:Uncharacterized protein n=2 Tax=Georhizobium profundi TaxID=2341112 RepID=A0A3Q8XTH8_9HYPH|nr:hypothetical protein D5400_20100 [Georhizobium profundi]